MTQITRNFAQDEFTCHCGHCAFSAPQSGLVDLHLVQLLQLVRDEFGHPITVSSGRRCPRYNKQVRGVSNSYHTRGLAADICATDMLGLAECVIAQEGFSYIELHDSYIHVDIGRSRVHRILDRRTVVKL